MLSFNGCFLHHDGCCPRDSCNTRTSAPAATAVKPPFSRCSRSPFIYIYMYTYIYFSICQACKRHTRSLALHKRVQGERHLQVNVSDTWSIQTRATQVASDGTPRWNMVVMLSKVQPARKSWHTNGWLSFTITVCGEPEKAGTVRRGGTEQLRESYATAGGLSTSRQTSP